MNNYDENEVINSKNIPDGIKQQLNNYGITITEHLEEIPRQLISEVLTAAKKNPNNPRDAAHIAMISKYPRFLDYIEDPSDKVYEVISY